MKRNGIIVAAAMLAVSLCAQSTSTKQPKMKSPKEQEAVMAMFNAQDADARIAAVEDLLTKFADTEFKPLALYIAAASAQQKNDFEKMMIYGERTLEADKQNYGVMLMMGQGLAQKTRENDLDKEEKLTQASKYATEALKLVVDAPKPRPDLPDEQWATAKKDFEAQGHETLGMVALTRKKTDEAIRELKLAVDTQPQKDPATLVRLALAYNDGGKFDEAVAVIDQINAIPDADPVIKQAASQQKVRAMQGKAAKK